MGGAQKSILVRVLDSPTPTVLVPGVPLVNTLAWSPDGSRLYYVSVSQLWSVTASGGSPQMLQDDLTGVLGITPDRKPAVIARDVTGSNGETHTEFSLSSPLGSPPKPLPGVSIPAETGAARSILAVAPDGARFATPCGTTDRFQICVVEYPGGANHVVPVAGPARSITWFPDSRHIVVNLRDSMRVLDTRTGWNHPLISTSNVLQQSSMSPDGSRLIYSIGSADYDILEASLDGKQSRPLVAGSLQDIAPHWSPRGDTLTFIRNYSSVSELWTQPGDGSRSTLLVKSTKGPQSLASPRFSPDGRSVAYAEGGALFTILATGGRPVELFREPTGIIYTLAWSPDGKFIVFGERVGSDLRLMRIPAGGGTATVASDKAGSFSEVRWSPDNEWIACIAPDGLRLISPDGKRDRVLTDDALSGDFSRDGRTFYALRRDDERKWIIVPIDVAGGREGVTVTLPISSEVYVGGLVLNPDGKRIAVYANSLTYDLWMIEGFPLPAQGIQRMWRSWIAPAAAR